ncbi:MAG: peptidylprolyl isomerase [Elusimicrobiales bacterium]|nr:peptidylprolyl isomerase [Elusimicrobiales bacterium]
MNLINVIKIIILGIYFFSSFSCHKKEKDKERVIARVGNTYITESYINEKIIETGEFDYLRTKIGKKQFLDVLINERLLKLAAENSSISTSKEYKAEVKRIEDEFNRRLEEYKSMLLTKMWLEKIRKEKVLITEKDVDEYLSKYPYTVSFEQAIAIDYETAQSIYKSAKNGLSFERISSNYRENSNVVFNKIPPVLYGELMDELNDIVFKLNVQEIGGIVKTKLGYHVIKKLSHSRVDIKDTKIKERAKRVLEKKKFDEYLSELERKYSVEVIDEEYK